MKTIRDRLFLILALTIGTLSLPASRAAAEIPRSGDSNQPREPVHSYQIKFLHPHASKLCVGQKTILEAEFGGVGGLTPLVPVSSITFWTSNGNAFSQESLYPVVTAGVVSSTFTAKNPGTDTLDVDVSIYSYDNGTPTGEIISDHDTTTITVMKCRYHFALHGQLDVTISKGDVYESLEIILQADGELAEDSDQPGHLSGSADIRLELNILALEVPGCTLLGYDPGLAEGTAEASADVSEDGTSVSVTIGSSKDFAWKVNATGQCEDQTVSVDMSGFTVTDDLVDALEISGQGGAASVQVPLLDKGLSRLEAAGATGSDSAVLTLTAEDTATE
jgi:hypothetical protein